MPNVTISVDDETYREMKLYETVNWSGVCRLAIRRYISLIKSIEKDLDQLVSESLTASKL